MLLVALLSVGMVGCAGKTQVKQIPDEFIDTQSVQTYLEEQNAIYAHGYIATITDEISGCLPADCDPREAEILNVENSISRIMTSEIMPEFTESGTARVVGAIYDIESGTVKFLD